MKGLFSEQQRRRLKRTMRGTSDAKVCRRCVALLKWDEGKSPAAVAREFGVTRQTLYNWRKRAIDDSAPLANRERPGRPGKWTGESVACLRDALEHSPRHYGFQMVGWTSGLLQNLLWQSCELEISQRSVRNKLHELGYVYKRFRYKLHPDPERVKKTAHP